MQLQRPGPAAPPPDLATGLALRARELGQRPAVSVLDPAGRAEQGFVTLAQWAAKGAHLLEVDHGLGPGDRVHVDVPAGWTLAAVCAAVWWTGAAVDLRGSDGCALSVVHEARPRPATDEVLLVGDAVDGSPVSGDAGPAWAIEVQAFPDSPPTTGARGDLTALVSDEGPRTHAQVVAAVHDDDGVQGVEAGPVDRPVTAAHLLLVAARPLVTGRATVVVRGVARGAADGDRVARWA